jgi:hypothetical protein
MRVDSSYSPTQEERFSRLENPRSPSMSPNQVQKYLQIHGNTQEARSTQIQENKGTRALFQKDSDSLSREILRNNVELTEGSIEDRVQSLMKNCRTNRY